MRSFVLMLLFIQAAVAAPEEGLRERIKDSDLARHWIYEDSPRAQAEARQKGKPLPVLLPLK